MKTLDERFWPKVDRRGPEECWPWIACINQQGYGRIGIGTNATPAHRVAYQLVVGPIAEGMHIDHVCHSWDATCRDLGRRCLHRRCVNPAHLEAVTPATNSRRALLGRRLTDRCPQGHEYTPENSRIRERAHHPGSYLRDCRTCSRAYDRQRWHRKQAGRKLPEPDPGGKRETAT